MNRFDTSVRRALKVAAVFSIALVLSVSCASVTGKAVSVAVNYGDASSVNYQIDLTRKALEGSDPVEALARAKILKENVADSDPVDGLYADAEAKTAKSFEAAVNAGQWEEAIRLFRSLDALSAAPEA